jgi:transcriptional regulator with XRE-family HTH domain
MQQAEKLFSERHATWFVDGPGLRELRTHYGLKLREIAEQVGITIGYLCDLEHGRKGCSDEVRAKLIRTFEHQEMLIRAQVEPPFPFPEAPIEPPTEDQ